MAAHFPDETRQMRQQTNQANRDSADGASVQSVQDEASADKSIHDELLKLLWPPPQKMAVYPGKLE